MITTLVYGVIAISTSRQFGHGLGILSVIMKIVIIKLVFHTLKCKWLPAYKARRPDADTETEYLNKCSPKRIAEQPANQHESCEIASVSCSAKQTTTTEIRRSKRV